MADRRLAAEGGQATVEVVAAVPAFLLAGLISLQLLAAGYTATLAGGAVEAGAIALAAGRPVAPAVREALPGWARGRVDARIEDGRISVTLRPPVLLGPLAAGLEVEDSAWVRPGS